MLGDKHAPPRRPRNRGDWLTLAAIDAIAVAVVVVLEVLLSDSAGPYIVLVGLVISLLGIVVMERRRR